MRKKSEQEEEDQEKSGRFKIRPKITLGCSTIIFLFVLFFFFVIASGIYVLAFKPTFPWREITLYRSCLKPNKKELLHQIL